jgi:hypothetical protein
MSRHNRGRVLFLHVRSLPLQIALYPVKLLE